MKCMAVSDGERLVARDGTEELGQGTIITGLRVASDSLDINLKVMLSQKDTKHGSSVYRYAFRKVMGIRINDKLKGLRQGDANQMKSYCG